MHLGGSSAPSDVQLGKAQIHERNKCVGKKPLAGALLVLAAVSQSLPCPVRFTRNGKIDFKRIKTKVQASRNSTVVLLVTGHACVSLHPRMNVHELHWMEHQQIRRDHEPYNLVLASLQLDARSQSPSRLTNLGTYAYFMPFKSLRDLVSRCQVDGVFEKPLELAAGSARTR